MKILATLLICFFSASLQAKSSSKIKVAKLDRLGVKLKYHAGLWKSVPFPRSLDNNRPDILLVSKKNSSRSRIIFSAFNKPGATCRGELKKLKSKKVKYRLKSLKGFDCVIQVLHKKNRQYIAVKETYRKRFKRHRLHSQIVLVENSPKSFKYFKKWLRQIKG